jgi:EAL domain-containing protein (putative c-di-GMP-specific phosphodiesterase class I)
VRLLRFALDDVGEGHSTLELLAASASEFLKMGRRLTMASTRSGSRAAIEAINAFARATGAAGAPRASRTSSLRTT